MKNKKTTTTWNFVRDQIAPDLKILAIQLQEGNVSPETCAKELLGFADLLQSEIATENKEEVRTSAKTNKYEVFYEEKIINSYERTIIEAASEEEAKEKFLKQIKNIKLNENDSDQFIIIFEATELPGKEEI